MADALDLQQARAWRASRLAAKRYRATGNPLYAWRCAGIALRHGLPMPSKVLEYVAVSAERLGAAPKMPVSRPQAHIASCLGMAGPGPSVFQQLRRYEDDLLVRQIAARARANLGLLGSDALAIAAEDAGREPDSIARQARRLRRRAAKNPP